MKNRMKHFTLLPMLLVCLSLFTLPVFALDKEVQDEIAPLPDTNPHIVYSLAELQDAIENADEGDEIFIGAEIQINGDSLCTDKKITLRRADDLSGSMIDVQAQGGTIGGFFFLESECRHNTISINSGTNISGVLEITDCVFDGGNVHNWYFINNFGYQTIHLYKCTFSNNNWVALGLRGNNDYIENCTFENNHAITSGAAFSSGGNLYIKDSVITGNSSGIYNTGTLAIENCKIYGNADGDIFNYWTMTLDETTEGTALYDRETGEMLSLPLESSDIKTLMCFTDEEAQIFFAGKQEDDSGITTPDDDIAPDSDEADTPDNSDSPDMPDNTQNPPDSATFPDNTDTSHTRPWRPSESFDNIYIPPVEQEETPEQAICLASGGLTLDIEKPLALMGYGNGIIGENDLITRAQIAVLLCRSLADESEVVPLAAENHFADVDTGAWYYDAVSTLASAGVIAGYDGLYYPDSHLTWGQLITILTRFVDAKAEEMPDGITYSGHWSYGNIVTAAAYGWIDDVISFDPDKPVTRGEAVEFINSIFEKCR